MKSEIVFLQVSTIEKIDNNYFDITANMKFVYSMSKYHLASDELYDVKIYNSLDGSEYFGPLIPEIMKKLEEYWNKYSLYCKITESKVVYISVNCYDIMDNILFDIRGELQCGWIDTDNTLTLLSTEIFRPEIYEQKYLYEWPGEYQVTDCETLKPLILERVRQGYYDHELIHKTKEKRNIK